MSALDRQEGGGHYKDMPIQPVEFITKNKLGFLEGCVIKRMCRWQSKDGLKDLRKAIHEIELLIEQTEEAEKREHAEREARDLEQFGPRGPKGDPANPEWPMRRCTCAPPDEHVFADCRCPPDLRGPEGVNGGRGIVGPDSPLGHVEPAPAADSRIPPVVVPEGQDWPQEAENGTRILVWRPRKPGDIGTPLYGWVEVGFMWDGELVRYDAEG